MIIAGPTSGTDAYALQILAAQTRLAKELRRRPELYQIYMIELLTLFADKGVAIQNAAISHNHGKVSSSCSVHKRMMGLRAVHNSLRRCRSSLLPSYCRSTPSLATATSR